jgi:hypothetical protein
MTGFAKRGQQLQEINSGPFCTDTASDWPMLGAIVVVRTQLGAAHLGGHI